MSKLVGNANCWFGHAEAHTCANGFAGSSTWSCMPAVCLGERGRHALLINKNTKVPFELPAIKIL